MANGLKIRGVTYRTFDEVISSVRELAAQYVLLPEDDDRCGPLASHIGELLAALPDERAEELVALMRVEDDGGETATVKPPSVLQDDVPEGHVVLENGNVVPLCPMCQGQGVLETEPPQDPFAKRCDSCDGYGTVYTGSRVPGQTTRACPSCSGNGWRLSSNVTDVQQPALSAAAVPEWPGAMWDVATLRWNPPDDTPPWDGATWNDLQGKWQ